MKLTEEQKQITNFDLEQGHVLKINAFAGTGKTTTLVEYVKCRPEMKFLYLCFNSAMRKEAQTKFPVNTDVHTAHSLAYKYIGYKYKNKLTGNLSFFDLKELNYINELRNFEQKNIYKIFNSYLKSIHQYDEFYANELKRNNKNKQANNDDLEENESKDVKKTIQRLWRSMCNESDSEVSMTHDGYLKLFHLKRYKLDNYDCILFDEAQDADPIMLDFIKNQSCRIIFVGDQYQQIYGFRGAVNAMRSIKANKELFLTNSFRFGKTISADANLVLRGFFRETREIIGIGKDSDVEKKSVAYLSRTNACLHSKALEFAREGKALYYEGGFDAYGFSTLWDIFYLFMNQHNRINSSMIRKFRSLKDLENQIEDSDTEEELKTKIKIIKNYQSNFPNVSRLIKQYIVRDKIDADYILSTVHRSKGQEYHIVRLLDDFPEFILGNYPGEYVINKKLTIDDKNILYVALTRAKEEVNLDEAPELANQLTTIYQYNIQENIEPVELPDEYNDEIIYGAPDIELDDIEIEFAKMSEIMDTESYKDNMSSSYDYYYSDDEVVDDNEVFEVIESDEHYF